MKNQNQPGTSYPYIISVALYPHRGDDWIEFKF